jgi:WD40 repeat protein
MKTKRMTKSLFLFLMISMLLAGCALPSMTPPPQYVQTEAPTITAPVPGTAIATETAPALKPAPIAAANAAQLTAAAKIPASNVQLIRWSSDNSVLALSTANMDAAGNNIYSAVLLDGKNLTTKDVWSPAEGRIADINYDGRLVAVISGDNSSMSIFDLGDGNKEIAVNSLGYLINGVSFAPDGNSFALSSFDNWQVDLRSLPNNNEIKTLTGFETAAPIYEAGFRGSSSTIIWKARATIQLQEIASGAMGTRVSGEDSYSGYELSPDGTILAGAAARTINDVFTPTVTIWNAADGSELRTLTFAQSATGMDFSADGTLLAVATGTDVQVFEVSSGNLLATLVGHSDLAKLVAFSPDGLSLVSTGQDNQLILWQVLQ